MPQSDDNLLDLSSWPEPPRTAVPPSRPGLPPRPVRPRTLPLLPFNLKGSAVVMLVLGTGLLVLPTSGCGSVVQAWAASPLPSPPETPPQLDADEPERDEQAVSDARRALAAWRPPRQQPAPVSTRTSSSPAPVSESLRQAVRAAERQVARDQAELDRQLAAQEASSDPASYDGEVAAAREDLDRSVAELDDARRALAAASRARPVTVVATPKPSPTPSATPPAELVEAVAEAQRSQAAHLAARQRAVADWRAGLKAETAKVARHNARVRSCGSRSAVPGSAGLALLALGAGALTWRRLTA